MSDIVHTPEQARAIASCGNVLVMAGAGTGKTRTLVERCLAHVARAEDPVPLDAVLLVTFTEAAAAEMRQRLRASLEKLAAAHPERPQLAAQLVLVETAHIHTLHGFCLQLVRDHFHELAIDPELTVLPNDRARLLAEETLDALMREQYEGDTPAARAVHEMLLDFDRARDTALRDLILRLHHYTQSLADPEGWYDRQRETLLAEEPRDWPAWLGEAFVEWRERWLPPLDAQPAANTKAGLCASTLREAGDRPGRDALARALAGIAAADAVWPRGLSKKEFRKPIEKFFDEAAFLRSLAGPDPTEAAAEDPLLQDWRWVRGPLLSLVDLAREFSRRFAAARREQGALDFHDLEQLALQLLWDRQAQAPTAIACQWRQRLPLLFIDEYQDINEAQDRILCALGRPDATGNRFLVGDVKQSIYRFRLANPRIFQDYAVRWGRAESGGQVLPLTGNFRSAPGILEFVNRLFTPLMRRSVGGIDYTEDQWLRPGAASASGDGGNDGPGVAPVELQLLLTRSSRGSPASDDDTTAIEKEAWLVAERLRTLHAEGVLVRDRESGVPRPVRWGDMAVLMRAPGVRAEAYARMFQQRGVPLLVARTGFYDSLEIRDLLGLLQLLDNPLQDQPLVAVLRSPLAGLSPDELACLRLAQRSGALWTALLRFHARGEANAARDLPDAAIAIQAFRKVHTFLGALGPWRELCRVAPLSECVENILDGSGYESWLAAQPRGAEAMANVRRLLALTRQFDQFQRQGLHRFLRFVEARRELDIDLEPGVSETADAVQLLSVHQSKGLEFPVVVVADCGHAFNLRNLSARVILDERFGLCSLVQPPGVSARYPSLPHWMASRHQRKEALGEEMRLLYVALTRARDRLILSGIATMDDAAAGWAAEAPGAAGFTPHQILSAGRWLDWLGPWLCSVTGHTDWTRPGGDALVRWHAVEAEDGRFAPAVAPQAVGPASAGPTWLADADLLQGLRERCAWRYGHRAASEEAAKASVSQLRRRAAAEDAAEARPWFDPTARDQSPAAHALKATQLGIAHHRVLETVRLDLPVTRHSLRNAVTHLREVGALSALEERALDFEALEAFWVSDLGQAIQSRGKSVERELPFTVRLTPADVTGIGLPLPSGLSPDEFIVVQGVADLVVVLPEALWLLDFKTDRVGEADLAVRVSAYAPQVQLYALALGRIYRRPVTRGCLHFLAARSTVEIPLFTGLSVPQP